MVQTQTLRAEAWKAIKEEKRPVVYTLDEPEKDDRNNLSLSQGNWTLIYFTFLFISSPPFQGNITVCHFFSLSLSYYGLIWPLGNLTNDKARVDLMQNRGKRLEAALTKQLDEVQSMKPRLLLTSVQSIDHEPQGWICHLMVSLWSGMQRRCIVMCTNCRSSWNRNPSTTVWLLML